MRMQNIDFSSIFRPNWGPKGQKKFFLQTAPLPQSQDLDDRALPPLIWRTGSTIDKCKLLQKFLENWWKLWRIMPKHY